MEISEALTGGFGAGLIAAATTIGVLWKRLREKDDHIAALNKEHAVTLAACNEARHAEVHTVLDAIATVADLVDNEGDLRPTPAPKERRSRPVVDTSTHPQLQPAPASRRGRPT